MQETRVWSLGWEDPLEKKMATHSSILAWKISWKEELGGLQSMGSQTVWHDWATNTYLLTIKLKFLTALRSESNLTYYMATGQIAGRGQGFEAGVLMIGSQSLGCTHCIPDAVPTPTVQQAMSLSGSEFSFLQTWSPEVEWKRWRRPWMECSFRSNSLQTWDENISLLLKARVLEMRSL